IDGYGVGVIAASHEGRPTKVEGNPAHPASRGALGPIPQATLFGLYDPSRASEVLHAGTPATWRAFVAAIAAPARAPDRRTHVLLGPTGARPVVDLVQRTRARGDVVVHFDSPRSRSNAWAGARLALGRALETRFDLSRVDVVLALDADFLDAASSPVAWA